MALTTITYSFSSTDTWTFESSNITITGSLAKITSRLGTADMFFASFNDSGSLNADYSRDGSTTVKANSTEVEINNEQLEFCGVVTDNRYIEYGATANHNPAKGCFEFEYIPKYTGTPNKQVNIFMCGASGTSQNSIHIYHDLNDIIQYKVIDSSGTVQITKTPKSNWSPVSGCSYIFQFNYNFQTGSAYTNLFIDGAAYTGNASSTFIRSGLSASITIMRIGETYKPIAAQGGDLFKINYLRIFDNIQNTASYTIGNEIKSQYPTGAVSIVATSAIKGSIVSFTADETNGSNTVVNFIFDKSSDGQSYYYDGNNWVSSDLSIDQANCEAIVNANISSILNSATNTNDQITPRILLQTKKGVGTPSINNIVMEANLFDGTIPEVVINFNLADLLGTVFNSATLKVYSTAPFFHSDILVLPFRKSLTADSAGNIYGTIIETESVSKTLNFELTYTNPNNNTAKTIKWNNKIVPNTVFVSAVTLLGDPD